jgi:hypothetical protein
VEQISTFVADAAADAARSPVPAPVEDLREGIVSAVLGHRGVLRLEPTLAGSLQDHGGPATGAGGGVVLTLDDRVVGVEIDISTRAGHQALRTAAQLRAELPGVVGGFGFTCGRVLINVLGVETAEEETWAPGPAPG